jgi:hypothetical protein
VDYSELEKLIGRADRLKKRLQNKSGEGAGWPFLVENGETHYISINGIKSPDEIEDDISSIFLWLWSLKDYVKKYAFKKGKNKNWVEEKINSDPYLCICADLANSLKHGGLDQKFKPRSGKSPKLGALNYYVPQKAMESLSIGALDVNLQISDSSLVVLEMPVLGGRGQILGDAFKFIAYSLKAWEEIIKEADNVGP